MPTYRTTLPSVKRHQGFDLRRTPTTGAIHAICTCDNLIVCDTHFWHGRTTPCERITNEEGATIDDSPCPACREKLSYRTHAYVSCFDAKSHEHFIFECTDHAARPLQDYFVANTTLRGCIFNATRPKGTPNGKVVIQTNTANLQRVILPQPPDLIMALAVIWRLPLTGLATDKAPNNTSRVSTRPAPMRRMKEQPDNAAEPLSMAEILGQPNGKQRKHATA